MRIDALSLIAAQSAPRPQAPVRPTPPADKPLFEPLNFPKAEPEPAPSKVPDARRPAAAKRVGSTLDITV